MRISVSRNGVVKQNLGVFQMLIVLGYRKMDLLRQLLDLPQQVGPHFPRRRRRSWHAQLRHLAHKLRVEKTLLARLRLYLAVSASMLCWSGALLSGREAHPAVRMLRRAERQIEYYIRMRGLRRCGSNPDRAMELL